MREVVQIANAKGIALSKQDILQHRERLKKIRYEGKPSTLQDIEAGKDKQKILSELLASGLEAAAQEMRKD